LEEMDTMGKQTAIVIGAGIGGIATAARLAKNDYKVLVLEKNGQPGGRCGQMVWNGHRFDTGPTLFLMPEVFEETYQALGYNMKDFLDLERVDPTYTIRFDDDLELTLTGDLHRMRSQLEAIEPGSFNQFLAYMMEGRNHYKISLERFVGRNFYNLAEYFSPGNLPLLFQLKALIKHYDNIGRYFRDERLKASFTFQNMYLGLSPYDAPATYSLLQYTELVDGIWFPKGGMYRVIESLVDIGQRLGVEYRFNSPVSRIIEEGKWAAGVELEDGSRLNADLVVANADLPYVYRQLLDDRKETSNLDKKKYTCSALTFYWAMDKIYPQLGMHNVFLGNDYKASFDRIFQDYSLPDEPSFYIHAPTRLDPSAAPPGKDTLMGLVPVGHLAPHTAQDWKEITNQARRRVLERLERMGVTDFEKNMLSEAIYSPQDWQNLYNLEKGAAFGLSHNFTQVGYLRPRNRHPRLKNLYFSGASTHPGTGLPIVLLSARLTTERILKEITETSKSRNLYARKQANI
jgi:phytoene desaturase